MQWTTGNWPDFTANKIRVNIGYEANTKVLAAPKTDFSVRSVDMMPTVRTALLALPSRGVGGLVFPRADGRMFARSSMDRAWRDTITATGVRQLRPYDLRHTYASLLVMAGRDPLYISRQMGHHSPGFTLTVYGHLMESLPRGHVEWADELVFPEGFEAALNLHLSGAPSHAKPCNPGSSPVGSKPVQNQELVALCSASQRGAWLGEEDSNPR